MSDIYVFIATKTTADVAMPTGAVNQLEYNRKVSNAFKARSGGRLTVGDLRLRPTSAAIANHLLCDGTAISRARFSELFRLLGTTLGAGDNSTTFNLPNYLGGALTVSATAPVQVISDRGTVSVGNTITNPTQPGQTGGTDGGNVVSGGANAKIA